MFVDYKNIYTHVFTKEDYNIDDEDRYRFAILEIINNQYNKIIDISTGKGHLVNAARKINPNLDVTVTDISKFNDLDCNFIQLDLANPIEFCKINTKYDFLTCLDVLEHLEEEHISNILYFFGTIAENLCISVANHSDVLDGIELHLTQKNKDWWDNQLHKYFEINESFSFHDGRSFCYVLKNK